MKKGQRITLTKKQADSTLGKKLLGIIFDVCHDGEIETSEIKRLHDFLLANPSDIPSAVLLRAQTREMLGDGRIDPIDEYNLKLYFVRIVPKELRGIIETHLEDMGVPASIEEEPKWHRDPATAKQIDYIIGLGGTVRNSMTKGQASEMIDGLLECRPPSPRQMMLLRFYNRLDLADQTKDEVSAFIDELFFIDIRYELAWDRFKRETGQDRFEMDPSTVPIGAVSHYMR
jgi:hypothetical protein